MLVAMLRTTRASRSSTVPASAITSRSRRSSPRGPDGAARAGVVALPPSGLTGEDGLSSPPRIVLPGSFGVETEGGVQGEHRHFGIVVTEQQAPLDLGGGVRLALYRKRVGLGK